jgi:hypothetical protein
MRKNILIVLFFIMLSSSISFSGEGDKDKNSKINGQNLTEHILGTYNNNTGNKKSPFLAVVFSLIVPGAGEYYANRFDVGKYSFAGEVGLWLLYSGMETHGYQVRNDGRSFARLHAGFNDENKNDDYYVAVSNFMNTYEYNDKQLRDRDSKSLYDPTSIMAWQWDSDANRKKFRDMRVSADNVLNNTKFVAIAMVANRVFSAINAARLTSKYNAEMNLSLAPIGYEKRFDGFALMFSTDL